LKEEPLDHTPWRNGFEGGYGLYVGHTTEWMWERCNVVWYTHISTFHTKLLPPSSGFFCYLSIPHMASHPH